MSDPFDLGAFDPAPPATAPAAPAPWLATLNDDQRRAVEAVDGPLLVLAGAGTGKTRVLTTRLAHILHDRRAWPGQILAVTFTNKAAREMRERVGALVGNAVEGMWLGTFHALGVRVLRRHTELVGLKPNFTILDEDDQIRLLKQILEAEGIDDKRHPARVLGGVINRWKDRGLTPAQVPAGDGGFADGRGASLYRQYQQRLLTLNACDFGDLLLHVLTLFTAHPDVLMRYQERLKYLLVDEYQDSNVAQYLWLRLLAQKHRNICCVGDDDQSIYGWRGAEVGNILRFEKDFPGARIIRLERNYRSTGHILGAASGLIARNEGRLGKTLWTDAGAGEKVAVRGVWDGDEEARLVGDEIEALQRGGHRLDRIAILVRAGFQTRAFEERFLTLGLKYRVIGGPRFYERQEIRDAIAYLRVIAQSDDDLAFERIVNVPKRGLGDATLQTLHRIARARTIGLAAAAAELVETDELKPRARTSLRELIGKFARWRSLIGIMPHVELAETVLEESGYTAMWQADRSPDAPGRLDNLKELVRALAEFENLGGFLEHVSLVMDTERDDGQDMVNLMTLHAAKGLEFDSVFLPGWEEGIFPNQRTLEEGGTAALEEERRLAYVGLTRAKQRCHISFAANRRIYAQWQPAIPSRFLDELPADHVEHHTAQGLYGSGLGGVAPGAGANAPSWSTPWFTAESRNLVARRSADRAVRSGLSEDPAAEAAFEVGARVFHQKFGYGRVRAVEDNKLTIAFDKAGEKRVMAPFVEPA